MSAHGASIQFFFFSFLLFAGERPMISLGAPRLRRLRPRPALFHSKGLSHTSPEKSVFISFAEAYDIYPPNQPPPDFPLDGIARPWTGPRPPSGRQMRGEHFSPLDRYEVPLRRHVKVSGGFQLVPDGVPREVPSSSAGCPLPEVRAAYASLMVQTRFQKAALLPPLYPQFSSAFPTPNAFLQRPNLACPKGGVRY